jgi:hypothetical protein
VVKVAIQQPTYLPWLGYFEQIARADVFVFLDIVQFEHRSWQNRNRLKTVAGDVFWLSVPVTDLPLDTPIKDVTIAAANKSWRKKHLGSIRANLGSAPYFKQYFPIIEQWLTTDYTLLADLNIAGIMAMVELLKIETRILRASDLPVEGARSDLVLSICRALNANEYYSAAGSKSYLDTALLAEHGITTTFQEWVHPAYEQGSSPFVPQLAAIDALMHVGADAARRFILPE